MRHLQSLFIPVLAVSALAFLLVDVIPLLKGCGALMARLALG